MSAFTQSDHVFLGLPCAFEHGTSILMTDLIQDEDRTTSPYHLRRLERRAVVISCIPSLAHNKSMEISSCGLMPQIHLIIDLSLQVRSGRAIKKSRADTGIKHLPTNCEGYVLGWHYIPDSYENLPDV